MHDCLFMGVKTGFLFNHRGRMCRKTSFSGYRICHNAARVEEGIWNCFTMDDREPVKLYLAENGLVRIGRDIVPSNWA